VNTPQSEMRIIILGSGTSFGLPQIGCDCRVCLSPDPRDARTRAAAVIEDGATRILIDTPPELRLQLLSAGIETLDAVFYTHDHADHVHGIDDLRAISMRRGILPVYGRSETLGQITERFRYIFDCDIVPPQGTSKPELSVMPVLPGKAITVGGLSVLPLELGHGRRKILGYRVGGVAYLTDVKTVPSETLDNLRNLSVLVVSALLDRSHPTHFSIDEAVEFAKSVGAERTFLTHLTHRHTHSEFLDRLPDGIEPAYDGLDVVF
jgi:phosphoribosyl 1,2-cyclic phosphate phosphodiesterase